MLNGIAPLLVFHFHTAKVRDFLTGIPVIGEFAAENIGLPLPIYLDEGLTGLYVTDESKNLDVETNVQARNDGKKPIVNQKGIDSLVTVNLLCSKNNILLGGILALADIVFTKVISKEYSISYFNGSTLVLNGLLHSFNSQSDADDDKIRITMQISKANQQATTPPPSLPTIPPVQGVLP